MNMSELCKRTKHIDTLIGLVVVIGVILLCVGAWIAGIYNNEVKLRESYA